MQLHLHFRVHDLDAGERAVVALGGTKFNDEPEPDRSRVLRRSGRSSVLPRPHPRSRRVAVGGPQFQRFPARADDGNSNRAERLPDNHGMQRVLLTGMSGVGKSTVAERLSELGFKVVETDYGGFSVVDEHGHQHWDVDRVRELLATEDADVLFVVGFGRCSGPVLPRLRPHCVAECTP